jgi:hypothetical protein
MSDLPWDSPLFPDSGPPPEAESFPNSTHVFEPLELYVESPLLIRLVERSLSRLNADAQRVASTPERAKAIQQARAQREEMLKWLREKEAAGPRAIFVALYPTSEFEIKEAQKDDL